MSPPGNPSVVSLCLALACLSIAPRAAMAEPINDPKVRAAIHRGLDWIANSQSRLGTLVRQRWAIFHRHDRPGRHGSGRRRLDDHARQIRRRTFAAPSTIWSAASRQRVDRRPARDDRYTYGHGYSMLFLSQVLGEEEDLDRRETLVEVLTEGRAIHRRGPNAGRRLGLRQRQGRPRFRRGLDHHYPGAGAARLPQCRHPRAKRDHRQGHRIHPPMHPAGRRRAVQFEGRRRPAGHHGRGDCLPVQRRRLRQRLRAQAAGLLRIAILSNIGNEGFGHWHYAALLLRPGDVSRGG